MSVSTIESRKCRKIIGRLAAGEEVQSRLLAICAERQIRAATILLSGVVDELALTHYDRASRTMGKARHYHRPLQIVSGQGALAEKDGSAHLRLQLVVCAAGDNGVEVLAGQVVSARVVAAEFVIETMDDVMLRRRVDRSSGLAVWQELIGATVDVGAEAALPAAPDKEGIEVRSTKQGVAQWTAAIAASARAEAEAAADPLHAEEPPRPAEPYHPIKAGDLLEHAKFGRCVIERVDANEEFATVRLRNKRLVRLNLEILDLAYQGEEDGHQVFGPRAR